jgi:Ice-binding-like/PEP-CTERM motif
MIEKTPLRHVPSQLGIVVAFAAAVLCIPTPGFATPILAADLATFVVLGASGVTNVATSTIGGNLGSAPNPSVDGGYSFTSGSLQANTPIAQNAQVQLDAAILALDTFGVGTTIGSSLDTWQSGHGGFITPGTYTVSADPTANLTGNLLLNGLGSNSAVWVFQFPSTLVTSTISNVTVTNVGDGANVGIYWNVHSAATLNGPTFAGNVLANTLISSDGNLTIECGRLLSANSQVTLNQDKVSITGCAAFTTPPNGGTNPSPNPGFGGGQVPVPEPTTLILLASGLVGGAMRIKRRIGSRRP